MAAFSALPAVSNNFYTVRFSEEVPKWWKIIGAGAVISDSLHSAVERDKWDLLFLFSWPPKMPSSHSFSFLLRSSCATSVFQGFISLSYEYISSHVYIYLAISSCCSQLEAHFKLEEKYFTPFIGRCYSVKFM